MYNLITAIKKIIKFCPNSIRPWCFTRREAVLVLPLHASDNSLYFPYTSTRNPRSMSFKIMTNFVSSCGRIDVFINVSSSKTRTNGNRSIRSNARNISSLKVKLPVTYTCEWERVIKFELAQQEEMFCNIGTCEFSQELWTVSRLLLISSIRLEADRTGQQFNYWEALHSMMKFLPAHTRCLWSKITTF